jgi:hypothetical protein
MDPLTAIGLGSSAIGLIGGLFGGGNPYEGLRDDSWMYDKWADNWLDPNNKFYKNAESSFRKGLTKSMSALSPTTHSILSATGLSQGGSYGGSVLQANLLKDRQTTQMYDSIGGATERFSGSLYQQGLNQYQNLKNLAAQNRMMAATGQGMSQQYSGSFFNALAGSGLSLLGQYGFRGSDLTDSWIPNPAINNWTPPQAPRIKL